MSSVCTEGEEKCPFCGSRDTGFDLECRTNKQELDCRKCGFSAHTRIVERGGKKFWEVSQQFPIGEGGGVRCPAGTSSTMERVGRTASASSQRFAPSAPRRISTRMGRCGRERTLLRV